jgi:hypothetical protein
MNYSSIHIGLDFDNTLIDYSNVFSSAAREKGWVDGASYTKKEIREETRKLPNGDHKWQVLQSLVYGSFIHQARIMEGAKDFLIFCKQHNIKVSIISHKTKYADLDHTKNLRKAALFWLEKNDFFNPVKISILQKNVFFHSTREGKIKQIAAIGCTHFVDDLEEVLTDPGFPKSVQRLLFTQGKLAPIHFPYHSCLNWAEIQNVIFRSS